jgi:hypothetical protein
MPALGGAAYAYVIMGYFGVSKCRLGGENRHKLLTKYAD